MDKPQEKSKKPMKGPTSPKNDTALPTVRPGPEMSQKKIRTDILGSYTGLPADGGIPTQDADDL